MSLVAVMRRRQNINRKEPVVKEQNILKHECQAIRDVFDRAGDMKKVIVVGIDPAEREHKAVVCNGHGDMLCKPLRVVNDSNGLAYLASQVEALRRKSGTDWENVIVGIESPGPWAENFADALMAESNTVVDIDPRMAKRFRENPTSDNDRLAAQSVCRCIIQKQGRTREADDVYFELLMATRHHLKLTRMRTLTSNRIHAAADILFPGVLNEEATGITPLGNASLDILEKLSVHRVKRMNVNQLGAWLKRRKVTKADEKARRLKALAERTVPPSEQKERMQRKVVEDLVAQYRLLSEQAERCVGTMAGLLRQTPHWLLTTIDGIGVRTAAQMAAELFARSRTAGAECKVNYAGLTSRTHQTGGDGSPQKTKGRPLSFNRHAKRVVLMAAESIGKHDKTDLAEHYKYRQAAGKNAKYSLGRKLIRFARKLNHTPTAYIPAPYRNEVGEILIHHYYEELAEKLERKWKKYLHETPPEGRDMMAQWFGWLADEHGVKSTMPAQK